MVGFSLSVLARLTGGKNASPLMPRGRAHPFPIDHSPKSVLPCDFYDILEWVSYSSVRIETKTRAKASAMLDGTLTKFSVEKRRILSPLSFKAGNCQGRAFHLLFFRARLVGFDWACSRIQPKNRIASPLEPNFKGEPMEGQRTAGGTGGKSVSA